MMGFDPAVEAEVARIGGFDLQALRDAWPTRFGPPPRLKSPNLLRRTLAWRLQVEAYGGVDADTRKLLAKGAVRPRGVTAQAGVRLVREWKLGSVHLLFEELREQGVRSKAWTTSKGPGARRCRTQPRRAVSPASEPLLPRRGGP